MPDDSGLQRFLDAQQTDYAVALSEIKRGRKASHWMWYVFPQIRGLGTSEISRYYAIKDIREAGRNTQGVKLIDLAEGDKLQAIAPVISEQQEETAAEQS